MSTARSSEASVEQIRTFAELQGFNTGNLSRRQWLTSHITRCAATSNHDKHTTARNRETKHKAPRTTSNFEKISGKHTKQFKSAKRPKNLLK